MDNEKRMEALEAQVRELTELVRELRAGSTTAPPALPKPTPPPLPNTATQDTTGPESGQELDLAQEVRERVDRVLGSDSIDTLESRIGAVWISRLAALATMTAVAFFANYTFSEERLGPLERAAILYALSAGFIGYGFFFRKTQEFFAEAILGLGLASLYFTTYALFNIEQVRLFAATPWSLVPLFLCLALMGGAANYCRSQTVAGIGIFLTYYTVVVSATQNPTATALTYALATCAMVGVLALAFHASNRWMLFSWAVLIATQATYIWFFLWKPDGLDMTDETYFWISNGFLTVYYVIFSLIPIIDARKTGEYRKGVAPMAGVNSFIYFALTWIAIREVYVEYEWMFRLGLTVGLLGIAAAAHVSGPKRNYLYQIFVAKAVVMFTLSLQAYLSGEKLLVAMALESLGLAFSYRRSGIVTFKVLGIGLMGITTAACLLSFVFTTGDISITFRGWEMPSNWFSAIGVAVAFVIVAWFYEKFVRRLAPEERTVKGQWFLADTVLDVHNASLAIIHASAASIVLLTITIIDFSDNPVLPYLLALEAAAMAIAGIVLRTPQIDVASVLLLVASHVCFHVFLWLPITGFAAQPNFATYTVLVALFTYIGAWAWERYLMRFHPEGSDLEHHVVAALPYLAATFMFTTLLAVRLDAVEAPAAQGALAMALLLAGSLVRLPAIKTSGIFAMGVAGVSFYIALYNPDAPLAKAAMFPVYFPLFLLTFVGTERLLILLQRYEEHPYLPLERGVRTALIVAAGVLGLMGLYEWSPHDLLILYILGMATAAIALGWVFRESRYRWGAFGLFGFVLLLAFIRFRDLSPFYQFLTFAAPAVVLLVVSWGYTTRQRQRHRQGDGDATSTNPVVPPDGSA